VTLSGRRERSHVVRSYNEIICVNYCVVYIRYMNSNSAVWCFACDADFATREELAQHVAESPVHRENERRLTLPGMTVDERDDCRCWTPSSPPTGDDSVLDLSEIDVTEGSTAGHCDEIIRRVVTAAVAANDDIASIKENLETEMTRSRVPVQIRSAVLITASAISKHYRRLTSASSEDDKPEMVEPSSAAVETLELPELFNPGDDFWNLGELSPTDETRPSAEASSIVLGDEVASMPPVLSPTGSAGVPASQRLPPFGVSNTNDGRGILRALQPYAANGLRRQPAFSSWCLPTTSRAERRRQRALERGFLRQKRV
jgi:hypothetical protein